MSDHVCKIHPHDGLCIECRMPESKSKQDDERIAKDASELAALKSKLAEMQEVVLWYKRRHDATGPLGAVLQPESCGCGVCDAARAALAQATPTKETP